MVFFCLILFCIHISIVQRIDLVVRSVRSIKIDIIIIISRAYLYLGKTISQNDTLNYTIWQVPYYTICGIFTSLQS